jgi:hypothetical protein
MMIYIGNCYLPSCKRSESRVACEHVEYNASPQSPGRKYYLHPKFLFTKMWSTTRAHSHLAEIIIDIGNYYLHRKLLLNWL